jgi:SAM-dependent methyltransferase
MELTNLTFEPADLARLGFESRFDLVVCIDVLEHIPAQDEALYALVRAAKPGGTVFLHMPLARPRPVPFSRHLTEFHDWAKEEHVAPPRSFQQFHSMVLGTGLKVVAARPTFGRWTGELATSLFALPYRNTPLNRVAQLALGVPCRLLAVSDRFGWDTPRYAACIWGTKPA